MSVHTIICKIRMYAVLAGGTVLIRDMRLLPIVKHSVILLLVLLIIEWYLLSRFIQYTVDSVSTTVEAIPVPITEEPNSVIR